MPGMTSATNAATMQTSTLEVAGDMTLITPLLIVASSGTAAIQTNGSINFSSIGQIDIVSVFKPNFDNYIMHLRTEQSDIGGGSIVARLLNGLSLIADNLASFVSYLHYNNTVYYASYYPYADISGNQQSYPNVSIVNIYSPLVSNQRTVIFARNAQTPTDVRTNMNVMKSGESADGIRLSCGIPMSGTIAIYGLKGSRS